MLTDTVSSRLVAAGKREVVAALTELCTRIGAAESSLLLPEADTDLVFFASTNPALMQSGAPRVPITSSFSGIAFRTGQSIAVADAASQEAHYKAVDAAVGSRTREYAAIPVIGRMTGQSILGILTLVNRNGGADRASQPFTLAELAQAETLANDLTPVIQALGDLDRGASIDNPADDVRLDPALMSDLTALDVPERRIVAAVIAALHDNRAG